MIKRCTKLYNNVRTSHFYPPHIHTQQQYIYFLLSKQNKSQITGVKHTLWPKTNHSYYITERHHLENNIFLNFFDLFIWQFKYYV